MNENPEPAAGESLARIIPFQRRSAQPPDSTTDPLWNPPRDRWPDDPVASRESAARWIERIRNELGAPNRPIVQQTEQCGSDLDGGDPC